MKIRSKILMTAAAFALILPAIAQAEIIVTKTTVKAQPVEGAEQVNFGEFDLNHDGILSRQEVGTKLFYVFDRDGNEVIDNLEFGRKSVLTIMPMEVETITVYDMNDDGLADDANYDYGTFIKQSNLMRFDKNMDGLSPREFIRAGYLNLDKNDSGVIELKEWQSAYIKSLTPEAAEQERYN